MGVATKIFETTWRSKICFKLRHAQANECHEALGNRNNPSAFQSQVEFLDMMKGIVWDSKLAIQ